MLSRLRKEQRVSVRALLERMAQPISAPTYARYESGQRALAPELLADICQALGVSVDEVLRLVDTAEGSSARGTDGAGFVLDPHGPQVPAIRVRVALLMDPAEAWLAPVRGMLRLHADTGTDEYGDLLLDEPLTRVIAQILGLPLLECWSRLTKFIDRD
ncbi:Helix-turn-helix domain-containing protein [Nakamurella panacisegetis]|uniref:Helix-turn-helix domain-containing protein n=1 Tax=Nakamurella panacisegetis TaxID=1090615 RepID=A0A1H0KKX8_9ACTN|nr:helix-turn-helix transcriptional regulator [Nakamurella panacisegetis]SDO56401.1 Helix-turn-helix domain-containing protein [Nakamurella panacisegetis]